MEPSEKGLRKAVVINRILALLLVGTAVWEWRLFALLLEPAPGSLRGVLSIIFYVLLVGSMIGLLRMSTRGHYFVYVLVPFATAFHGIALVPFLTSALPSLALRIVSVFVLNCAFLVAAVVSHRLVRRARSLASDGGRS